MDDILINAIRPLFDLPPESKGTLLGVVRMLNDPYYRKWVISHCTEKTVQDFWLLEFASWGKNDQSHNVNSSLNKIRRFQSSPILRRVLGQQRSRINIARAIEEGQILIFDFTKHHMGAENANVLASLILSRLIYEGTRRTIPQIDGVPALELVTPFHIYVDEFHSVTSLSMVEALSGIRKFRVGLTLAHQYTDQLSDTILDAIKGNVGTKLVFRVGGDDAERLYANLDMAEPKHLADQSDYEFFASLKEGSSVATKRGYTLPPVWEKYGHADAIRSLMASHFARPVTEIDATYERWQTSRHYGGVQARPTVKNKEEKQDNIRKRGGGSGMKPMSKFMLN